VKWRLAGQGAATVLNRAAQADIVRAKAIGLRLTVHQFRHAAAAIYLKHHPGDYETVRRFLGHRDIQTTTSLYCGLLTMQATEQFGKLIRQQIKFDPVS
jgi:integrase